MNLVKPHPPTPAEIERFKRVNEEVQNAKDLKSIIKQIDSVIRGTEGTQ